MQFEVRVFSGLEKFIPGARFGQPINVNIKEHVTCRELLARLNIPEKEVLIILVNGINRTLDDVLVGGERISLFPPVGGG